MTSALTLSPSVSSAPQAAVAARPGQSKPEASVRDGGELLPASGPATNADGARQAEAPASFGATLDRLRGGTAPWTAKAGTDAAAATDTRVADAKPHTDDEVPDDALLLTAWMGPSLEAARLAGALNAPAAGSPAASTADAALVAVGDGASGRGGREPLASQAEAAPPAASDQAVVAAVASAAPAILKALTGTSGTPSATESASLAADPEGTPVTSPIPASTAATDVARLSPMPPAPVFAASGGLVTANATKPEAADAHPPAALADAADKVAAAATAAWQAVRPAAHVEGSDAEGEPSGTSTPLSASTGATALVAGVSTDSDAAARPAIAPEVGSDAWGPALGQQMIRIAAKGDRVAELELNPIGLGPLKVRLAVNDNQAQAMFMSGHESVRQAVEAALPQLRTTLASHGISLGQTSVGGDPGQAFFAGTGAERNPSHQQQQHLQQHGASFNGRTDTPEPDLVELPQALRPLRSGAGFATFA